MIEQLLRAENAHVLGLLDQAEQIYAQTLAHDPANAIALVGLSRVALERGDEPAALSLARRALSIDPENAQAGRMVDRLEEVIRERGDAIPREEPTARTPVWPPTAIPPPTQDDSAAPTPVGPPTQEPAAPPTTPPGTPPSPTSSPAAPAKRPSLLRRLTGRS